MRAPIDVPHEIINDSPVPPMACCPLMMEDETMRENDIKEFSVSAFQARHETGNPTVSSLPRFLLLKIERKKRRNAQGKRTDNGARLSSSLFRVASSSRQASSIYDQTIDSREVFTSSSDFP
jgi:hypothetical protein